MHVSVNQKSRQVVAPGSQLPDTAACLGATGRREAGCFLSWGWECRLCGAASGKKEGRTNAGSSLVSLECTCICQFENQLTG